MKKYFIEEKGKTDGPYTLEELENKNVRKSTLVWVETNEDWMKAEDFPELFSILITEPPPLPKAKPILNPKYNYSQKKTSWATWLGIIIFISGFLIYAGNYHSNNLKYFSWEAVAIGLLILRIFVVDLVVNIADGQNRNTYLWGWFAFFLPSISLIIIGQLHSLKK